MILFQNVITSWVIHSENSQNLIPMIKVGEIGLNHCSLSQSLILILRTPVLLVAFNMNMH